MIKNLNADRLIDSELFIREPVEDICKRIENCNSSKIILTGGRGVGKSVVLRNKEKGDLFKGDKSIYMWFDPVARFDEKSQWFDEEFITHYYEIHFFINFYIILKRIIF